MTSQELQQLPAGSVLQRVGTNKQYTLHNPARSLVIMLKNGKPFGKLMHVSKPQAFTVVS